ncbi:unnamed protein product [Mytilus coruscus]|uniref:Uncharacterized protein n=1 Tax=Mytilus coruscus TaxID=42192 RepID=A0A6J8DU02_MYTCO|nr:unnamed protein product [Mytilus coruscus]
MASYGESQESWDSTEGHSPPRAVSTIDTALESNEEAHYSGDSSLVGEAETTLVDEENKHVHVRQGELIAQAVEVETIEVPAKVQVVGTGVGTGPTESDQGVPEHLRDLFDRSNALLGSQEQEALASLLREMSVDSPCQDFKTDVNLATLPCGGCPYCARAQAQ